jgi:hypothetical protein
MWLKFNEEAISVVKMPDFCNYKVIVMVIVERGLLPNESQMILGC